MKRTLLVYCLFFFGTAFAQFAANDGNRFQESEEKPTENQNQSNSESTDVPQPGPGNPGTPVPVDMYIPFLVLTALGAIVYYSRKRKTTV